MIVDSSHPQTHSAQQTGPKQVTFTNSEGKIAQYYFYKNPWRFCTFNRAQKVFLYCIICGEKRVPDEAWSGVIENLGPPTICKKISCWNALEQMPAFVPSKYYIVTNTNNNLSETEEHYDEIEPEYRIECVKILRKINKQFVCKI